MSPPPPTTLVFPALIIPSITTSCKVKLFTVLYQMIFMLSLVFLWPHFPQFRFFAPFLMFHFPLHCIFLNFMNEFSNLSSLLFLSECILLIQFFDLTLLSHILLLPHLSTNHHKTHPHCFVNFWITFSS